MTPVWWMAGGGLLTALAIVLLPGMDSDREVMLGMLAPMLATTGTWVVVERTYRWRPERLTPLMMMAFGGKMVFFGVYVTLMLTVLTLRPAPFVISFTSYFIALYAIEAFYLRRLFEST
jgi:hypothetical protein